MGCKFTGHIGHGPGGTSGAHAALTRKDSHFVHVFEGSGDGGGGGGGGGGILSPSLLFLFGSNTELSKVLSPHFEHS